MDDRRRGFLERLFKEHRRRLLAYFYPAVRAKHAAPDLVPEVYLRLGTVKDTDAIRDPERYLWTVARNVLNEYRLQVRWLARQQSLHTPAQGIETGARCHCSTSLHI